MPRDGRTRLVVVRKENSGRSEASNAGVNAATEPLVAMIDADSILDPDALLRVAKPFADDPTRVVADRRHHPPGQRVPRHRGAVVGVGHAAAAGCRASRSSSTCGRSSSGAAAGPASAG